MVIITAVSLLFVVSSFSIYSNEVPTQLSVSDLKAGVVDNTVQLRDMDHTIDQLYEAQDGLLSAQVMLLLYGSYMSYGGELRSGIFYDDVKPALITPEQLGVQIETLVNAKENIIANLHYTVDMLLSQRRLLTSQVSMYDELIDQTSKRLEVIRTNYSLGNVTSNAVKEAELNLENLKHNREKMLNQIKMMELQLVALAGIEYEEGIQITGKVTSNSPGELLSFEEYLEIAESSNKDFYLNEISLEQLYAEEELIEKYKRFVLHTDQMDIKHRIMEAETKSYEDRQALYTNVMNGYKELQVYEYDVMIQEEKFEANKKLLKDMQVMKEQGLVTELDIMNFEIQVVQSEMSLQATVENRNLAYQRFESLVSYGIPIQGGF
jgi:hypothetical protein